MTREEVRKEVLSIPNSHVLLELPTSFGKTKLGLDRMVSVLGRKKTPKILIVIPRVVLIDNWKEEFKKWKLEGMLKYVKFSTYVSVPKATNVGKWDVVIFDECHRSQFGDMHTRIVGGQIKRKLTVLLGLFLLSYHKLNEKSIKK